MSKNVQYKVKCNKYEKNTRFIENELDDYKDIEVIDENSEKSWV